jgi:hypothetical protein
LEKPILKKGFMSTYSYGIGHDKTPSHSFLDLGAHHPLCIATGAASTNAGRMVKRALPRIAGLYRGVFGAASGAGIAIGAYFAFYGAATNVLVRNTQMKPASIAFTAGAIAAAGGSIVKVPLAVCIRSVQAGVYPNVIKAASEITAAAGRSLCHAISRRSQNLVLGVLIR